MRFGNFGVGTRRAGFSFKWPSRTLYLKNEPRAAIDKREIVRDPGDSSKSYAARNFSPTEGIRDTSQSLLSFAVTTPGERPEYSIGADKSAESGMTALFLEMQVGQNLAATGTGASSG